MSLFVDHPTHLRSDRTQTPWQNLTVFEIECPVILFSEIHFEPLAFRPIDRYLCRDALDDCCWVTCSSEATRLFLCWAAFSSNTSLLRQPLFSLRSSKVANGILFSFERHSDTVVRLLIGFFMISRQVDPDESHSITYSFGLEYHRTAPHLANQRQKLHHASMHLALITLFFTYPIGTGK